MGVLWHDNWKTRALASFEGGIVYKGDGVFREQIGTYTSDEVYDRFGKAVAKFNGNTAYNPLRFSIEAYCTFYYGTIYKGGSRWNDILAVYDGDQYGACAAAVLFFELYSKEEQGEKSNQEVTSLNNRTTDTNSGTPQVPESGSIIGAIIVFLLGAVATYAFYFTEWGHNMVFGEEAGRLVFFICMACAIVSFIIIYRSNSINDFFDIAVYVLGSNTITYIIVLLISLIEGASQDSLSFGNVLMLIIGAALGTVGVASLFCLIEIPVLYIAKRVKNSKK